MGTPIRAIARVRPVLESDNCPNGANSIFVQAAPAASQVILGQDQFYDFDAVFGPDVSQKELYSSCLEDLVNNFFEGYNVSVVGYGACGSGKTYSITGPGFLWAMNEEEFGLLPRAVRQLYKLIVEARSTSSRYMKVTVSYLLLSAGAVYDLLSSQPAFTPLPILADNKGSVVAHGLSSIECASITEALNCLEAGLLARHNHASSLSPPTTDPNARPRNNNSAPAHTHASFTITLQQERLDKDGKARVLCSSLNFVDLAGLDQQSPSLQHVSTNLSTVLQPSLQETRNRYLSQLPAAARSLKTDPSAVGSPCSNSYSTTEVLGVESCTIVKNVEDEVHTGASELDPQLPCHGENCVPPGDIDPEIAEEGALNEVDDEEAMSSILGLNGTGALMAPDHQCLASVVACLVDKNFNGPVPYAHSMLTQLLKEGLGGNCLTLLVCCAAPCRQQLPATALTLRYGGLARYILNKPVISDLTAHYEAAMQLEQQALSTGSESLAHIAGCSDDGASEVMPQQQSLRNSADIEEIYRLQVYAVQLQQLLDSAECILRAGAPFLPATLQSQVGSWLRHRSEQTVCAAPTLQQPLYAWGTPFLRAPDDRTLHVIEELSEPGDLKTSSRNASSAGAATPAAGVTEDGSIAGAVTSATGGAAEDACSVVSSVATLGEEFHEQLAVLTTQFADNTALLVRAVEERMDTFSEHTSSTAPPSSCSNSEDETELDDSHEKMDVEREHSVTDDELAVVDNKHSLESDSDRKQEELLNAINSSITTKEKEILHYNENWPRELLKDNLYINAAFSTVRERSIAAEQLDGKEIAHSPQREGSVSSSCSDANMDSYDSEEEALTTSSEEACSKADSLALPSVLTPCCVRATANRRNSSACLQSSPLTFTVGALHVHQANKRRQRELRDTIREKESQLRTLQRAAKEKNELLRQNEAKLRKLQQLADEEAAKLSLARQAAANKPTRSLIPQPCSSLVQCERSLQQYRQGCRAVQSLINIIQATKIPSDELERLMSRLRELRCELAEVETLVREEEQREAHLTQLRRDRPRRQSGHSASDDDFEVDIDDPLKKSSPREIGSSQAVCHVVTAATAAERDEARSALTADSPLSCTRTQSDLVQGSTHVLKVRKSWNRSGSECQEKQQLELRRGKAVVSVHGVCQPHKRRLLTSSSEQCLSSMEEGTGDRYLQLRIEIGKLRDARDTLAACRQRLNRKMHRGSPSSEGVGSAVERRLLELDEAVEAVDSAIEYKNELLCGRQCEYATTTALLRQGKLLDRLLNLSMEEVRTQLVKYFNRVVDIRIEFRKQEIAYSKLEHEFEDQSKQVQRLEWSYQQASLDLERQCAVQQRLHLQHLHKLFRHLSEQESASLQFAPFNERTSRADVKELEMSLFYYREQCTQLKSVIKQQQSLGFSLRNVQQHEIVAPAHQHQREPDCEKRVADIGMKLMSIGPGGSLSPRLQPLSPHSSPLQATSLHENASRFSHPHCTNSHMGVERSSHRAGNSRLPWPQAIQSHASHSRTVSDSVGHNIVSPPVTGISSTTHNPFQRRSRVDPRGHRRRPHSSYRLMRSLDTSRARGNEPAVVGQLESVPLVEFGPIDGRTVQVPSRGNLTHPGQSVFQL